MDYVALVNVDWTKMDLADLQTYAATLQAASAELRDVRGAVSQKLAQLNAAEFFNNLPEGQKAALAHVIGNAGGVPSAEAVGKSKAKKA